MGWLNGMGSLFEYLIPASYGTWVAIKDVDGGATSSFTLNQPSGSGAFERLSSSM